MFSFDRLKDFVNKFPADDEFRCPVLILGLPGFSQEARADAEEKFKSSGHAKNAQIFDGTKKKLDDWIEKGCPDL
ncbi:hypothetical protein FACS1894113_3160 [Alphaproteobacteria bacterium]|nr:hypothetical protein FACS1894113_3160 [Alphaproteobacteria bacterium]